MAAMAELVVREAMAAKVVMVLVGQTQRGRKAGLIKDRTRPRRPCLAKA